MTQTGYFRIFHRVRRVWLTLAAVFACLGPAYAYEIEERIATFPAMPPYAVSNAIQSLVIEHNRLKDSTPFPELKRRVVLIVEAARAYLPRSSNVHQTALWLHASILGDYGWYAEALAIREELHEIAIEQHGHDHQITISALQAVANLMRLDNQHDDAEEHYAALLSSVERVLQDEGISAHSRRMVEAIALDVRNVQWMIRANNGDFEGAERFYLSVLHPAGCSGPSTSDTAAVYKGNLGALYVNYAKFDKALRCFESLRLDDAHMLSEHEQFALRIETASVYSAGGDFERANGMLAEAAALSDTFLAPDHPERLWLASNLAKLRVAQGRYGEADQIYAQIRRTAEALGPDGAAQINIEPMDVAAYLYEVSTLFAAQGLPKTALESISDSIAVIVDILPDGHLGQTLARARLAEIHLAAGRPDKASLVLSPALDGARERLGDAHPETVSLAVDLSTARRLQNRPAESLRVALQATQALDGSASDAPILRMEAASALAEAYASNGDAAEAITVLERAFARSSEDNVALHPVFIESAQRLARLYVVKKRYADAAAAVHKALRSARDRAMREQQSAVGRVQRALAAQAIEETQALALTLTSRASEEGQAIPASLAAETILWLKGVAGEYDAALNRASAQGDPQAAAIVEELRSLWTLLPAQVGAGRTEAARQTRSAIDAAESALESLYPGLSRRLSAPSWREIAETLPDGSALIDYMIYTPREFSTAARDGDRPHIAGVVLRNAEQPVFRELGPIDERLEADIAALTRLNEPGVRARITMAAAHRIYNRLALPFESLLSDVAEIYLSPDDVLHRIPLEALRSREGRFWGIEKIIHIVPTGRALQPSGPSLKNDGQFVAMGGADYGGVPPEDGGGALFKPGPAVTLAAVRSARRGIAWGPLPGAVKEVRSLSTLFASSTLFAGKVAQPLTGSEATEAAMRSITGPPAVLHLATHGGSMHDGLAVDPLSRVALGFANANRVGTPEAGPPDNDGLMLGTDIARLSLHGTRLVALSACETGVGVRRRGEGVMSLAHAFRLTGSESVLMTYWPVDDDKTRAFMAEFYDLWLTQLADDPQAKPDGSLRVTKRRWNERGENLKHWAAYALIENQIYRNNN